MNELGQPDCENLWGYAKRLRFIREMIAEAFPLREARTLRVLDVGCGNGSQLALPLVRWGFQLTGLDTDDDSIEHAKRLAADATNAQFICGRVEELPGDALFDVVILSEVLEHLTEPARVLKTSAGHLAAGGILIVTVPNGYGEFEIDSWFFQALRLQSIVNALARGDKVSVAATDNHESGHIQFFTRRRLARLFAECDLKVFREGASVLFCGPLAGHTLARSPRFVEWNARVADKLPLALSSGWYFALRREHSSAARVLPRSDSATV
ncbi:MAG: methyltransferase domain-containing protein [Acidobacteria bacterium]|nr:methyltransferase domain-containing protein [Acidobacteriota bacterium]